MNKQWIAPVVIFLWGVVFVAISDTYSQHCGEIGGSAFYGYCSDKKCVVRKSPHPSATRTVVKRKDWEWNYRLAIVQRSFFFVSAFLGVILSVWFFIATDLIRSRKLGAEKGSTDFRE